MIKLNSEEKSVNYLKELQAACGGMTLSSILITPIQRIPRYIMFVKELIANTPKDHPDFLNLNAALALLQQVAKFLDSAEVGAQKSQEIAELVGNISNILFFALMFISSYQLQVMSPTIF